MKVSRIESLIVNVKVAILLCGWILIFLGFLLMHRRLPISSGQAEFKDIHLKDLTSFLLFVIFQIQIQTRIRLCQLHAFGSAARC